MVPRFLRKSTKGAKGTRGTRGARGYRKKFLQDAQDWKTRWKGLKTYFTQVAIQLRWSPEEVRVSSSWMEVIFRPAAENHASMVSFEQKQVAMTL